MQTQSRTERLGLEKESVGINEHDLVPNNEKTWAGALV